MREPLDRVSDYASILAHAVERLRNKLEYTTVGFQLLPSKFTLGELQTVDEAILGKTLDKKNFRRKIAELGILKPLQEYRSDIGRPAQLFQFGANHLEKLKYKGIISIFPF